jgi:aminoglycoside phosphotransferase (APT) family kinase protein
MIGKTISHYRILEKLGGGGMGVDFLTMEYVEGETLAAKAAAGPLAEKDVIALGAILYQMETGQRPFPQIRSISTREG